MFYATAIMYCRQSGCRHASPSFHFLHLESVARRRFTTPLHALFREQLFVERCCRFAFAEPRRRRRVSLTVLLHYARFSF